jgi:hypothetical protein
MIAIKNRSGKIGDRFLFLDRSAIFPVKSIGDFHFQIGSRLKSDHAGSASVVNRHFRFMYTCLTFHNRIPIFPVKSISDFYFSIGIRFLFSNRNHDRDRKPFRKNRGSIFMFKSISDFCEKICLRSKNRSGSIAIRFPSSNRILVFIFTCGDTGIFGPGYEDGDGVPFQLCVMNAAAPDGAPPRRISN